MTWEDTLITSTLFQQVRTNSPHPGWMVESDDEKEIILAVGNNGPERFDKWRNVKVLKATGELFEWEYGKEDWVPLKPAPKP